MKNKKIFILVDYRGGFYSSTKYRGAYMDYKKIKKLFEKDGYSVEVENFSEVDFRSDKYTNSFVLYQSSEDPNLKYKDFIEDIILGLQLKKAILIPEFKFFRAHHNKLFMEILRDVSSLNKIKNLKTKKFGTIEEFIKSKNNLELIKVSAGSSSKGVFKFKDLKSLKKEVETPTFFNLKMKLKSFFDKKPFTSISNYREKFISQNFIENLDGDYRILIYGNKHYVLYRKNRKNDFRASGGGNLSFVVNPKKEILDFSEKIKNYFNVPIIALDVADDNKDLFLIEFMFIPFGNYALEKSDYYFQKKGDDWVKINEKPDLEKEFVNAIDNYIQTYK